MLPDTESNEDGGYSAPDAPIRWDLDDDDVILSTDGKESSTDDFID